MDLKMSDEGMQLLPLSLGYKLINRTTHYSGKCACMSSMEHMAGRFKLYFRNTSAVTKHLSQSIRLATYFEMHL